MDLKGLDGRWGDELKGSFCNLGYWGGFELGLWYEEGLGWFNVNDKMGCILWWFEWGKNKEWRKGRNDF